MTSLPKLQRSGPVLSSRSINKTGIANAPANMTTKKTIYLAARLSVGGAEKFMTSLSNSLCSDDHQQLIVSLSETNPLEDEIDKRIPFIRLPRRSKFDSSPVLKLRKLIKTENADSIFCLNFFSYFMARIAMIGLKTKSKRIISYHSTIHVSQKDHFLHKLYAFLLSRKDLIVTVSQNQADYTAKKYKIPAKYFQTIHNGVDTGHWKLPPYDWNKKEIRSKYGLPENAKVIIIAAAFRPEKNHLGAIKALQILRDKYNIKAHLLFAGDGIMREKIEAVIREQNMQDYVKLAGNQKDLRPLYWSSDVFSLSSTSVETFSIAALEAMACGLPGVLTNIGGANEMITDGSNGYLCEPNENSIAEGWAKAFTNSFSKESINNRINENFSLNQMVCKYKKILL
jgi:glycosyltransferase involved in cell wall biosynthesis